MSLQSTQTVLLLCSISFNINFFRDSLDAVASVHAESSKSSAAVLAVAKRSTAESGEEDPAGDSKKKIPKWFQK